MRERKKPDTQGDAPALASSTQRHVSTQVPVQRKRQGHEQATKNDVKSKPVGIESQGKLAMKTLIIGLGNPILGEDGVGWKVAKQLTISSTRTLPSILIALHAAASA